jgi:imidazolonepropionase
VALALATDFNPGTSPVLAMPEAISVGCALYRLPPLEAVVAATVTPARVLGVADRIGSLAPGRQADFVVLDGEDVSNLPYRPGHNPVVQTFVGGEPSR